MSKDKEKFDAQIRRLMPINEFSNQLQNRFIEQAEIMSYEVGVYIFEQGDTDDFTYYLIEGQLEMQAMEETSFSVTPEISRAKYPLAQVLPRQYSAKTITPVKMLRINRDILEGITAKNQNSDLSGGFEVGEVEAEAKESLDWMSIVLQSSLFAKIPAANIQQLFVMLNPISVKAGDTIIKQGEEGDFYYIIQEGRCEVTRSPEIGAEEIRLAELKSGNSFGEESLLSDKPRNASVKMLTDGILMQLSKDDFVELIKKPTLQVVSYEQAEKLINQGAIWIDVRSYKEHKDLNITGSLNIPLFDIRLETDQLQVNKQYITYCDTGAHSATAAFLLTEHGFNACYLDKGLRSITEEAKEKIITKSELDTDNVSSSKENKIVKKVLNSDNQNSIPDADIAALDSFLDEVESDATQQAIINSREQRRKLQDKIKGIIKEKQQEATLTVETTENGIPDEIQPSGKNNTVKSEQVRHEVQTVVEHPDTAQTDKKKEIVIQEGQHVEEHENIIDDQYRVDNITEEKKELEAMHLRNVKEMEELQKMRREAEELIRKEREALDNSHAEKVKEIQVAKEEAERERVEAEENARKLREKQKQMEEDMSKTSLNVLDQEIKSAENKLSQANKTLIYADQAEKTVTSAKAINEQELLKHKEEEERLRKQVEEELASWSQEQEEQQKILVEVETQAEQIKRIRERTELEKIEAQKATEDLFSDITEQLHKE